MSQPDSHIEKTALVKALECRSKAKFNLEEFLSVVSGSPEFKNINERGVYIACLAELLLKAFLTYSLRIKGFTQELEQREVKKRKRREGGERENVRRNKKGSNNQRRDPLAENRNIEDLSNESLSNPSNIERPRIMDGEQKPEENSNPPSSKGNKGDDSQSSKDSDKNKLKIELNKITEQIRGHEETFISDPIDDFHGMTMQDNSQSSSSQERFSGEIRDFNEKLKILSMNKSRVERTGAKTRQKGRSRADRDIQTKTKKKNAVIMDQSTMLDDTRINKHEITLNETLVSAFETTKIFEFHQNFVENLQHFNYPNFSEKESQRKPHFDDIFNGEIFQHLHHFELRLKGDDKYEAMDQMHDDNEFMINNDGAGHDISYPDYTMSQPLSQPVFNSEFMKESIGMIGEECTLDDLLIQTGKEKSTLFYQLLWRSQNEEISLTQENPESFTPIFIHQN